MCNDVEVSECVDVAGNSVMQDLKCKSTVVINVC